MVRFNRTQDVLDLAKKIDEVEAYIFKQKKVSVTELQETFELSESTVRRYISDLLHKKSITKEYGAIYANTADNLINIRARIDYLSEKKIKISKIAAGFVRDGETLFFDSGTTHMPMVEMLVEKKDLTIVTNNLLLAIKAADLDCGFTIIMINGRLHNETISIVGDSGSEFLNKFFFDKIFLTTSGISPENGFSNRTLPECSIKRTVLPKTKKSFILADDSKFGRIFPFSFGQLNELDYLITNTQPSCEYIQYIKNSFLECLYT